MNNIKQAAVKAAVAGGLGLGGVLGLSVAAGAATPQAVTPPITITTTSVLESSVPQGGGITVENYNEYVPSASAPGYSLYAQMDAVCTTVSSTTLCTWRMHVEGAGEALIGNFAVTATGRVGQITAGTGGFKNANGIFSSQNIAPGVGTDTFVFVA